MSEFNRICFACKSKLKPSRNKDNQFIFIDNKFYHEDCFKKITKIYKTCFKCKKEIDLCNEKSVKFQNHFYHYNCFSHLCTQTTAKWKNARKFVDQYEKEAIEEIDELKTKYDMTPLQLYKAKLVANQKVEEWYTESDLFAFIREKYNTSNTMYTLIKQVFDGRYKGLQVGIPPAHLLDMWQQKSNYLDKIYLQNQAKGKTFTTDQRIKYDLAILVNRYDRYLKWLQTQEVQKAEIVEKNTEPSVLPTTSYYSKTNSNSQDDLIDIVDDIFGGGDEI